MSPEKKTDLNTVLRDMRMLLSELATHFAVGNATRKGLLKYGITEHALDSLHNNCLFSHNSISYGFEEVKEDRQTIVELRKAMDPGITALRMNMNSVLASLQKHMADRGSLIDRWDKDREACLVCGDYLILSKYYQDLKLLMYRSLVRDYNPSRELVVNENSSLLDSRGMGYAEFPSDIKQIKEYAETVCLQAREKNPEEKLILQQQIMEIIKNAIRHGNERDINKKVKVWYRFAPDFCRVIVEDEGQGFHNLEEWNAFFRERNKAIANNDMGRIFQYMAFSHDKSEETDGGNALFAAAEFWDSGLIYNRKRNRVAAMKYNF